MSEPTGNEAPATEGGLLEGVEPAPAKADPAPEGNGVLVEDRPDWLPEQFWDAEKKAADAEKLAKSWKELTGKVRQKLEPPEKYELELPEGMDPLTEDDEKQLRELGLTNDQAGKFLSWFRETILPEIAETKMELEQTRLASLWGMKPEGDAPLGTAYTQRLAEIKSWASNNLPEKAVAEMQKTATGVNAIYELMQAGFKAQQPAGSGPSRPDKAQLEQLMQDPRYYTDPDYQNMVRQKFVEAYDR